jgi:hypothetical protein
LHPTNPHWGFPLSRVCAAARGKGPGKWRRGGASWLPRRCRCAAAGGHHGREEPDEGEAVSNRSEAEAEQDATVNTDDAPPLSSSLRRLHRRPDVSQPTAMSPLAPSSFLVLACGRAFESPRAERAAPPFPHGRTLRRATPAQSRHRGYPRPQRPGALVSGWLRCCFAGWTRDSPATRLRALRRVHVMPCVQGLAFVPSWFVQGGGCGGDDRAPQCHGQARAYHPSSVLVGGPCFFLCSVT